MRTVMHYIDSEMFGGSEEAALHLMAALDRTRWDPVLLHHPAPGMIRLAESAARIGVRTIAVPPVREGEVLHGVRRVRRAIRAERPAIVHAHLSWPLACRYGILAAWLARVPALVATAQLYIEFAHQPGGHRHRQQRLMVAALRRVIAVSQEVKARYAAELHVPPHKLAVVPNGIPVPASPAPADPALRRQLLGGRPDYLVLTPARFHEQKGHAYLVEAAALVPEATFVFAGDGPLRAEIERRAGQLGIADRCLFLGQRADVPQLLAAADLFVLPSLFEGLPLSVLEAMAARRPVVATAIGGTDEAVTHEENGLLVPPRDPAALASAIRRLQADRPLAERLAAAGRARVEREFASSVTAAGVMRIYDEVVGPTRGANATPA